MKRALRIGVILFLLLFVGAGALWVERARRGLDRVPLAQMLRVRTGTRAPDGVRVKVQVLNTTRTRGLARRATRLLRDRGFDVVEMGTTGPPLDSTLVLDRSGHPAWAAAVAEVMSPAARTEARPDSSRYLDVTVLIGRHWRPPSEPFHP